MLLVSNSSSKSEKGDSKPSIDHSPHPSNAYVYDSNGNAIPISNIFNINGNTFMISTNQQPNPFGQNLDQNVVFRTGEENFGVAGEEFNLQERMLYNELEGKNKFSVLQSFTKQNYK